MDAFALLEDKVRKAAALVRELKQRNEALEGELPDLRQRNQRLEEELPGLRARLDELQKALRAAEQAPDKPAPSASEARRQAEDARRLAAAEQELKGLRQEREEVRLRIARLIEVLDGLEPHL